MPEMETVEIRSWKDPTQRWVINAVDYDASIHTVWSSDEVASSSPQTEPDQKTVSIPASDQVRNSSGASVGVYIVNPQDARQRIVVSEDEYDPDHHRLWSSRGSRRP